VLSGGKRDLGKESLSKIRFEAKST